MKSCGWLPVMVLLSIASPLVAQAPLPTVLQAGKRVFITGEDVERKRIDHLAKGRDLFATPGEVAVSPIGEGCKTENRRADDLVGDAENLPSLELRQQHHHEERHEENPRERQRIGQVHERRYAHDNIGGPL